MPFTEGLANDVDQISWDNHHRGGAVNVQGLGYTLHPSLELVKDYQNWDTRLGGISKDWESLGQRQFDNETLIGPFRPAEINTFEEKNTAAYVRLDFESDEFKFPFSGNVGFRYVEVEHVTAGSVTYPDLAPNDPNDPDEAKNFLPADDRAFGTLESVASTVFMKMSLCCPALTSKWI